MNASLMTVEEVAVILDVEVSVLRSKSFRKRLGLPAIRVGRALRFRREDVEQFSDLVTDAEVSEFLNVSIATIRNKFFLERAQLEPVRFGKTTRFRRADVEAFVERNTEGCAHVA